MACRNAGKLEDVLALMRPQTRIHSGVEKHACQGTTLRAIAEKVRSKVFAGVRSGCRRHPFLPTRPHVGYLCGYRSILFDLMARLSPPRRSSATTRPVLVTGASDVAAAL